MKLTKKEFLKLSRKQQEKLISEFTTDFSKKDKEEDLWKKYEDWHISEIISKPIEIPQIVETKTEWLACPLCGAPLFHVKDSDYKCKGCGHGFSGYPQPKVS